MTQFTEAFYKTYYATKKELEAVKEEWDRLTPCFAARSFSLQELLLETIHLYEQLVQLEKLWGVYCVSYTEALSQNEIRLTQKTKASKNLQSLLEKPNEKL